MTIAIASCSLGILFNAVSWPFHEGDALALYAPFGKALYETRVLPVGDRMYEAYPMLVPMAYALTHWAAGGTNEYLARLVPALMSVGAIAATGVLGRSMASPRAGLMSATLVALTPSFGRWASTGYTDAPAALYVGLLAAFAWHWWIDGDRRALVLAGASTGLAMWTRNSTLAFLPALACLVAARHYVSYRRGAFRGAPAALDCLAVLAPIAIFAAPWYLRNLWLFGFMVPPTIWTDRASHTGESLAIMLRSDQAFGLSGWLFTLAIPYGIIRCATRGDSPHDRWYVLVTLFMPFFAAWWWLASYESRFLVTVIPLLAVMAGLMLDDLIDVMKPRLSPRRRRWVAAGAAVIMVIATIISLRKTVEHKAVLIRNPLLTDAERHRVQLGGLYEVIETLNELPDGSRLGGVPSIARYHLHLSRFASVDLVPQLQPPDSLADRFDFVVYRHADGRPLTWTARTRPLLRTSDGYAVYATVDSRGRRAAGPER
jgi:hypothetical protein